MYVVRRIGEFRPPLRFRTWLLCLIRSVAVDSLRAQKARRKREEEHAVTVDKAVPGPGATAGDSAETRAAVEQALLSLEERYRLPIVLHYSQGLTHAEVAKVLGTPPGTVSVRIARGKRRLRQILTRAGFSAALNAEVLRRSFCPTVPASLEQTIRQPAAGKSFPAGNHTANAGTIGAKTSKGGLAVKIGLGLAVIGLSAGLVFAVGNGGSEETAAGGRGASAAKKKPRRFSTPVSDPNARWTKQTLVFVQNCGDPLDGPRVGMQTNRSPHTGTYFEGGGDWYMRRYDPELERYFTVAGDAAGYLDGPLSRARFGTSGYAKERRGGRSPDGRYQYFTEPTLGGILRCIDWKKKEVKTILKKVGGSPGMAVDTKGNIYIVSYGGFQIVTPEGVVKNRKLEFRRGTQGYALSLALDEVRHRLYAARRDTHVWYWDLNAGGKYVEVLNASTSKVPHRKRCATGSFDGLWLHCPAGLNKSPDEKEVNFLYFGGGDDRSFYRLDLKKRWMLRFRPLPGKAGKGKNALFYFGESPGKVGAAIRGWCHSPGWKKDAGGDFYLGDWKGGWSALYLFTRVK